MLPSSALRPALGLLALAAVGPFAVVHCGNGDAPNPLDAGGPAATATVPTPATDGGDASATSNAFYAPKGCPFTVAQETTRPFTGYALDDTTAPADPSNAIPMRVRVGVNGGTAKGGADYADLTTTTAFRWETGAATTNARVRYGTTPGALTGSGALVQTGYVFTSPPPSQGIGESDSPAYFHEADVCGLTPGTTYYYQVGGGAAGKEIWSAVQSFTTVPATGPIVVGVFGDARDTVGTWGMVNQRMVGQASLILISGDIVDIGVEESLFSQWLDEIWGDGGAPFGTLGQIPIVPIAGNHEAEASQFYANFTLPGSGPYAGTYSSFDVGNTHFVMIDDQIMSADATGAETTAQLAWLSSDLAAADADRANHPFIVTVSHRGMFSTSNHASDSDVLATRGLLAPLFDKYHVTLAMNGHDHEYERSLPLNAGSPANGPPSIVDGGTTYVINAGAGADPYAVASYTPTPDNRAGTPTALGSALGSPYVGCYVLLTLDGTTLAMKSYGMKASGASVADDVVIDSVTFGQ